MKGKKIRLTNEEVFKKTHCPKCNGVLETFEVLWGDPYCYCPKCNILKTRFMSFPYLCSDCDSEIFVGNPEFQTGDFNCFLCNGKMRGMSTKEFSNIENKLRRGYYVANATLPPRVPLSSHLPCHQKHPMIKRHNNLVFSGSCLECNFKVYILVPKWMQDKFNIQDEIAIKELEK